MVRVKMSAGRTKRRQAKVSGAVFQGPRPRWGPNKRLQARLIMSGMALPTALTRVILGFLVVMSCAFSVEGGSEMATTELHKTLVRRWIDEVWNKGDMAVADEIFAPTYVHRTPTATIPNLEAFKKAISGFRAGLPDVKVTIEDLLTDGDKVVTRWVITGTHRHELMGFAPTNKQ